MAKQRNETSMATNSEFTEKLEAMSTKEVVSEDKIELHESSLPSKVVLMSPELEKITETRSFSIKDVQKARIWFASLSGDDRLVALGFQDEEFLDTIFRAATYCEGDSATDRQVDWMASIRSPAHVLQVKQFDVMNLIDKEDVGSNEKNTVEDSAALLVACSEEEPVDSTLTIALMGVDERLLQPTEDVRETGVDASKREDSDDFRIRADDEASGGSISRPFGESGVTLSNQNVDEGALSGVLEFGSKTLEKSAVSGVNWDTVQFFASNVVAVFPSVSKLGENPDSFDNNSVPVVSLRRSFLLTKSGDQLLELFDEMLTSGKFLSEAMVDDWNVLAKALVDRSECEKTPLHILLLWRLQLAVARSFVASSTHLSLDSDLNVPPTDATLPPANYDGDASDTVVVVRTFDDFAQSSRTKPERESLVNLLPSIFDRLLSLDDTAVDETIWDFGSLLAVLLKHTSVKSALQSIDECTGRRICNISSPVTDPSPAEESLVIESSIDAAVKSALDEEEKTDGLMEAPDSGASLLDVSYTKNSKRRKKRKKKKGSTFTTEKIIETSEEPSTRSNDILDNIPLPILPKVDECTQTEDVFASDAIEEKGESTSSNGVKSLELKVESVWSASSHSTKSGGDKSDELAAHASSPEHETPPQTRNEKNDLPMVEGFGIDVTNPSLSHEETMNDDDSVTPEDEADPSSAAPEDDHDHDAWATVEVRTRGNRKKPNERNNSNGRFGAAYVQNGSNAKKKAPRNPETRKRSHRRKMARDILFSVLDTVHDQVMKRSQQTQHRQNHATGPRAAPNAWGTIQTKKNTSPSTFENATNVQKHQRPGTGTREGTTLRNILMGKSDDSGKALNVTSQRGHTEPPRQQSFQIDEAKATVVRADQNTAPTLTETLSAVSAVTEARSTKNLRETSGVVTGESSSNESVDATKRQNNSNQSQETQVSPPLPTLLSPGNSATSSVASSLEAPHAVHHNHLSYVGNENDVGYHLLRVCDRLTRDIGNFMKRREEALTRRRQERKLVLSALQDSLTTIWPGGCKVQMYGSCATDLDLPSSDLDVVVCGLDQSESAALVAYSQATSLSPSKLDIRAGELEYVNGDNTSTEEIRKTRPSEQPTSGDGTMPQYPLSFKPMTTNAERVVTLALELERQPWAVHVKAIPTATVPVIKILADPARFQGMGHTSGEWLAQQPHRSPSTSSREPNDNTPPYHNAPNLMPWRGADVVNGLLSVDITFEGPEHGGIGSTIFSTRVVEEFSRESGLPADSTAPVQVLMVLKELLAQRRLNEPFSGGLSSYALLLLVISVVRERGIIRKELELVERQRRLVAAGGGNAVPQDPPQQTFGNQKNSKVKKDATRIPDHKHGKEVWGQAVSGKSKSAFPSKSDKAKRQDKSTGQEKGGNPSSMDELQCGVPASSSWASIAGKSLSSHQLKVIQDGVYSDITAEPNNSSPTKIGSFAEVAAKGTGKVIVNTESTKKHTKTSEPNKGKAKGPESKQTNGAEQGSRKSMESMEGSQRKTIASKLPATASIFEPKASPSHNGSIPTRPNTSMGDESGSFFPQSFHDVIEVLCSGETTPGKLLMHFLLFYGQHFDSHSTAIDYSDTHQRDPNANNGYAVASPYMQRRNTGFYDPVTGMFTVDPIVIFDPLVGAEANNVARSCFAWSSIRWVFAQSYMTLSSAVEMSAGHHPEQGNQATTPVTRDPSSGQRESTSSRHQEAAWGVPYRHDESGNVIFDPKTPLLELLLSF